MPLDMILGTQWGDEGKGRMVDLLSADAEFVARFSGGDNAGHTVTVGKRTFKLHLIPSGLIHPQTIGVLGNGMVINPVTLMAEMQALREAGIEVSPARLHISHAAHLITPAHLALDAAQEKARGSSSIGTTLRGIGPAYTDKTVRHGLRVGEMLLPETFGDAMEAHIEVANQHLTKIYNAEPLAPAKVAADYVQYARRLADYIHDVSTELADALADGKRVLAEGAQGTLLDLDLGTYPYVTSSHPTAAGVLLGLGLGVQRVGRVIGVTKAFQTRVGAGPFPSEVTDRIADHLRGTGEQPWDEFGTTTGRPRRVGWLDLVLLRYATQVNGLTELALTKLDVITGLKTLRVCVSYRIDGKTYDRLPMGPGDLSLCEPIYEEMSGWDVDIQGVRDWDKLPDAAQDYIVRIETLSGLPVHLISVGPERSQVVQK